MTTQGDNDKTPPARRVAAAKPAAPEAPPAEPARHIYGPRALAALLPALLKPAYRKRSAATAQLLLDWEAIVGPDIAAMTTPRKLFAGTLSIAASGPAAMELQHVSDALMGRINTYMGRIAVTRLRFTQDMAGPSAPPPRRPPPQAMAAARTAVETLPEGKLRDALESLGRVVLAPR